MAGGRPLPRAAEQGPRGGPELLEDRALPPSSSLAAAPARLRPQRQSSRLRAGEPWERSSDPGGWEDAGGGDGEGKRESRFGRVELQIYWIRIHVGSELAVHVGGQRRFGPQVTHLNRFWT